MRFALFVALLLFASSAQAEQLAVATDNGDSIELHDRVHGKCPPGLREAIYFYAAEKRVPPVVGCWDFLIEANAIVAVFADGDVLTIPVDVFTWKRGKKPVAL